MLWLFILIAIVIYFFVEKQHKKKASIEVATAIRQFEIQYPTTFRFYVKGLQVTSYRNRLAKCDTGDIVQLDREPENKFDPNAIKVMSDAGLIGYVPADKTEIVYSIICNEYDAYIDEINVEDEYISCKVMIRSLNK